MDSLPLPDRRRRSTSRSRSRSPDRHRRHHRSRSRDRERKRDRHSRHGDRDGSSERRSEGTRRERDRSREREDRSPPRRRHDDDRRHDRDDDDYRRKRRHDDDGTKRRDTREDDRTERYPSSRPDRDAAHYSERDAIARADAALSHSHLRGGGPSAAAAASALTRADPSPPRPSKFGPALQPPPSAYPSSFSSSSSSLSSTSASSSAAPAPLAPPPPPPLVNAAPNFGLSGALAADAGPSGNTVNGKVLKWSEPAEARVPSWRWHLHIFKGDEMVEKPLYIHRQSAYLIGRDRAVVDIPTDHPSCSGQHAVIQYRLVDLPQELGSMEPPKRTVKPYIMDLESTNGTFLNGRRIASARYIELLAGDVLKFGSSSRDYVLLHDEMAAASAKAGASNMRS